MKFDRSKNVIYACLDFSKYNCMKNIKRVGN